MFYMFRLNWILIMGGGLIISAFAGVPFAHSGSMYLGFFFGGGLISFPIAWVLSPQVKKAVGGNKLLHHAAMVAIYYLIALIPALIISAILAH
jgi:hypothetical protein